MRLTAVLPLLFLVPIDSGPGGPIKPSDPGVAHSDQIEAYASMIAGATRAEKVCTGYRTNMAALAGVRTKSRTIPDEQVGEVQMATPGILEEEGAGVGHKFNEEWRKLPKDSPRKGELAAKMRARYAGTIYLRS